MRTKITFATLFLLFLSGCSLGSGNDGGIFRSDDGGKTFNPKNAAENNATVGSVDVMSIAINPQNNQEVYIGTKSNGIYKSESQGELWKALKVADTTPLKVYAVAVDRFDTNVVYATAVLRNRAKIMKSTDSGNSWREVYTEPANGSVVLSIAIDPQNSNRIFAGTDQGQIIFSEDGGETWRSTMWTSDRKAVYKIAFDNFDSNTVYFVIFQSGVLRTVDGGKNFQELKQQENQFGTFEISQSLQNPVSIKTDPLRADWIYVGTDSGLLRSRNRGDSWEKISTLNEPKNFSIRSIDINPVNSDEIIFTAAQTFYKTVDGGVNWFPVQSNSSRTLEVAAYDSRDSQTIFIGLNKR